MDVYTAQFDVKKIILNKMKTLFIVVGIVILSACNQAKTAKNVQQIPKLPQISNVESTKKDTITTVSKDHHPDSLLGLWAAVGENNATFKIKKSSIFYVDNNQTFKYAVNNDSIKIFYEDGPENFQFKLAGADTLILTGLDGPSKFYRFKK